ncbi:unnamed protein product [Linum trigynum]|uniref:Uncharacterized protein n=1 Tax=Linum trigynum TaxID=586398 RepID=A0AAV2DG01_9ROSI
MGGGGAGRSRSRSWEDERRSEQGQDNKERQQGWRTQIDERRAGRMDVVIVARLAEGCARQIDKRRGASTSLGWSFQSSSLSVSFPISTKW